jgi:hypothetical protein
MVPMPNIPQKRCLMNDEDIKDRTIPETHAEAGHGLNVPAKPRTGVKYCKNHRGA